MCLAFPSSLNYAASEWFYSLPPRSLCNIEEVTEAFLTQHASRQEGKKNSHHLLSVKMRQSDSLKSYIAFFQSQRVKVPNCSKDVSALAFISGLQVSHPMYKYLLKHNVTLEERGLVTSSTLHPIGGGNKDFHQPYHEA